MLGKIVCSAGPSLALFNSSFTRGLADLVVIALACLGLYYLWMLVTGRAPSPGAPQQQPPRQPLPPVQPQPAAQPARTAPAASAPAPQPVAQTAVPQRTTPAAPPAAPAQPQPVAAPDKPTAVAPTPAPAGAGEVFDAELVSVIAAAVACVLGRPHQVLDIKKITSPGSWVNPWAIEGRFQHYSSHKVR